MRKLVVVAVLGGVLGVAEADELDPLSSTFVVDIGWFFVSTDTRLSVNGETSDTTGSDVDFDDTFAVGDLDRFRGEAAWRFADRHVVRAMYFQNNRSGTRTLDRNVTFRGQTYPVNASVTATSELSIAQLSYDYAFMHKPTYEVAAGIGIHYIDIAFGLDGEIAASGAALAGSREARATTAAPLPVVGLRALWRFAPDWYLTGQAQYFHLNFEPFEGSLLDLKASVVWQFAEHVGVGVAYNDFGFRVDVDNENRFNGQLRWDYGGAIAFVSVIF
jgi:hypothetical protein